MLGFEKLGASSSVDPILYVKEQTIPGYRIMSTTGLSSASESVRVYSELTGTPKDQLMAVPAVAFLYDKECKFAVYRKV